MQFREGKVTRYLNKLVFRYVLFSSDQVKVPVEKPPAVGFEFDQDGTRYRVTGLGETRPNLIDGVGVTMRHVEVEVVD